TDAYPGWRPDMKSPILQVAGDLWTESTGKAPKITAIHAGLECGVLLEKYPGMDMVSFGPDIRGAHSPEENLSIPSTRRIYTFLKALLKKLAA
ncbi:MAG TPA: M20/M25/M40 family metallo-hydrolase, partial [Myxococcota bacterium]|nr:M20/M25/M40 family metallo-hydrolase [Myxococcota bacterium]